MSRDIKYIGMDVHKEATVIVVVNGGGKLVMESIVETKASSILQFIHGLQGELHVTWEEGTWAAWLYDLLQPQAAPHCIQMPIRMITNSAGFTGATPITQINRPLSMSSCVIVSRPHLTKNASSGFAPCSPPVLQNPTRKFSIDVRTTIHNAASFGSNTTHCSPRSMDCSR